MKKNKYAIQVGESDKERIILQHKIFGPGTEVFLEKLKVKPGQNVLVIGCGAGDELFLFSKLVGPQGKVVGIDQSLEQIEVASQRTKEKNLSNIEFKNIAIEQLNELNENFDVVYGRMVLVHVPEVENAIDLMFSKVKKGGYLACEEPEISTCQIFPHSPAVAEHITLLGKLIQSNGGDPELGTKLFSYFKKLSLNPVDISFFQPAVIEPALKKSALLSVQSCAAGYLAAGLCTPENIQKLLADVKTQLVENPESLLVQCRMTQVLIQK